MVAIVLILVVAAVSAVMILRGDGEGPEDGREPTDIESLEPFTSDGSDDFTLIEGGGYDFGLWFTFYLLELPDEVGEVSICFIDEISVRVTWMDEPDAERLFISWENQPDTVQLGVIDGEGMFESQEEGTNPIGGEGELTFHWERTDKYIAHALMYEGDDTWSGVDGWEYVDVTNDSVYWDDYPDGFVTLLDAGDQTHDLIPLIYNDDSNMVRLEVTMSGHVFWTDVP